MTEKQPAPLALPERRNHPYDEPDALALIEAVREYLDTLMQRSSGSDRWLLRISANALGIASREIELGPDHRSAHTARLAELGVATDRELAELIRSGELDHRWDEVRDAIAASVEDSLAVANPSYADHPE